MALSTKAGNFALNTGTGNQSITGVGFEPKIVLFFPTNATADGVFAHTHIGFGVGVSSSDRRCFTSTDEDAQATTDSYQESHAINCFIHNNPGSSGAEYEADLVSLDADGFTFNLTTAPATAKRVGYLAIGGTDLTNVATGSFLANGETGNQAVTGVGFEPGALLFFNITEDNENDTRSDVRSSLSWAISSSKRGYCAIAGEGDLATSDTARQQGTGAAIFSIAEEGVVNGLADLVSMDADGFTVNWSDASTKIIHFVALRGGQYDCGSITSQTGTGNFSDTSMSFTGAAMILMSFCNAADAGEVAGLEISLGIATSSSDRFVTGGTSEDNQGTSDCDSFQDDGLIYQNYDYAQSVEGAIDFVSFQSNGFTLDQTDADPSGNQMLWFVIGATAAGDIKQIATVDWANVKAVATVAEASIKQIATIDAN